MKPAIITEILTEYKGREKEFGEWLMEIEPKEADDMAKAIICLGETEGVEFMDKVAEMVPGLKDYLLQIHLKESKLMHALFSMPT